MYEEGKDTLHTANGRGNPAERCHVTLDSQVLLHWCGMPRLAASNASVLLGIKVKSLQSAGQLLAQNGPDRNGQNRAGASLDGVSAS
jgi:hypothetical protein